MIPTDPYGVVGLLALPFAHWDRSLVTIGSLSSADHKTFLDWRGKNSSCFLLWSQ